MRPRARTALGAILAAIATLGIGAASRAPWTASPADRALLRLSWRAQSEATEECRPLSEKEKAELPVHMRVPEVCETRAIPYLLQVRIDGSAILAETVHGTGAREDRPIYVFREISLAPGRHELDVEFAPITDEEDDEEEDEAKAIPLKYSETIVLGDREVALVTYDPERRALVRVVGR
jgi:hypothetical protein